MKCVRSRRSYCQSISLLKFSVRRPENNHETLDSRRQMSASACSIAALTHSAFSRASQITVGRFTSSPFAQLARTDEGKAQLTIRLMRKIRNGRASFDIGKENMQYLSFASDAASMNCIRSSNSIFPFSLKFLFIYLSRSRRAAYFAFHSVSMEDKHAIRRNKCQMSFPGSRSVAAAIIRLRAECEGRKKIKESKETLSADDSDFGNSKLASSCVRWTHKYQTHIRLSIDSTANDTPWMR